MAYRKNPIIIMYSVNDDNINNIGLPKKSDDSGGLPKESGDSGLPRECSEDNSIKLNPKSPIIVKNYPSPTYIQTRITNGRPQEFKLFQIRLIKVRHRELQRIVSANIRE